MADRGQQYHCEQVRYYYYDYLDEHTISSLPPGVRIHIDTCEYCRNQTRQLSEILNNPTRKPDKQQKDLRIISILEKHFSFSEIPLTCDLVRPLLPGMADSQINIRIPTPVTIHLDKCAVCADHLAALRTMDLTVSQLERIETFLQKEPPLPGACTKATKTVIDMAECRFDDIHQEPFAHIVHCPECWKAILQQRRWLLKQHRACSDCHGYVSRDLFDIAFPYGIDIGQGQAPSENRNIIHHVHQCSKCLSQIQYLQESIYNIWQGSISGIKTEYHIYDVPETKPQEGLCHNVYADWPIAVNISHEDQAYGAKVLYHWLWKYRMYFVKICSAAAVISLVMVWFFTGTSATATSLDKMQTAYEKAGNIVITKKRPDSGEISQQIFIMRAKQIVIVKNPYRLVLYDVSQQNLHVIYDRFRRQGTYKMTPQEIQYCSQQGRFHSILVERDLASLSTNNDIHQLEGRIDKETEDTIVYQIENEHQTIQGSVRYVRQIYIEPETDLPQQIHLYQQLPSDQTLRHITMITIEYLDEDQMQSMLKGLSGQTPVLSELLLQH